MSTVWKMDTHLNQTETQCTIISILTGKPALSRVFFTVISSYPRTFGQKSFDWCSCQDSQ